MTNSRLTQQPGPPDRPFMSEKGTLACVICQAVYTPAPAYVYLLKAPAIAFESAFMSMCHFCFRCRRPACPSCWDDVHAVCGICTLEAHLPFRAEADPLHGVLFSPQRQEQARRIHAEPERFICVRPGRFQRAGSLIAPIEMATTLPMPATPKKLPSSQVKSPVADRPLPPSSAVTQIQTPAPEHKVDIDKIATRPAHDEVKTHVEHHPSSIAHKIEIICTNILLFCLFFILLCILSAEFSSGVNAFIANLLHIDIRLEVAYLWQLINQLHF